MINKKIDKKFILPIICSAAILRKEKVFRALLIDAKMKKISANKIYEALLQNYLFAGYPSALISLRIFKEYFVRYDNLPTEDFNLYHYQKLGEQNCRKIYGDKFEKLISNVSSFSPEMSKWLVLEGYGKVLGRKNLSLIEREYCIISVLAALKFEDQLYSHINGAIRLGAPEKFIKEIISNLKFLQERKSVKLGLKVLDKLLRKRAGDNPAHKKN